MKNVFVASLALALLASTAMVASAAEPAVSNNALSSMGLGGMQQMSDDEGLAVRGKGTSAGVWGGSTAAVGRQVSNNDYQSSSSWAGHGVGRRWQPEHCRENPRTPTVLIRLVRP